MAQNGAIQAYLDLHGVPYTGAGPAAVMACGDKLATATVLSDMAGEGVSVLPSQVRGRGSGGLGRLKGQLIRQQWGGRGRGGGHGGQGRQRAAAPGTILKMYCYVVLLHYCRTPLPSFRPAKICVQLIRLGKNMCFINSFWQTNVCSGDFWLAFWFA
jgi:hypothetical protein